MTYQTTTKTHSSAVYHIKGTPFVGIIDNVPDEQTAIAKAIENIRCRPMSAVG